jgi:hypothetical protein
MDGWMRLPMVAAVLLVSAAPFTACEVGAARRGNGDRTATRAAAEAAVAGLFDAINANDPGRVMTHYHRGDELVQVACTEVRRGFSRVESIIHMWQQDQPQTRIEHQVERTVELGPDAAVVAARGRNQDGLGLFWTFVLQRRGGNWVIIQEHQSWADCREPRIHRMN